MCQCSGTHVDDRERERFQVPSSIMVAPLRTIDEECSSNSFENVRRIQFFLRARRALTKPKNGCWSLLNAYSHNDPDPYSIITILLPNQCLCSKVCCWPLLESKLRERRLKLKSSAMLAATTSRACSSFYDQQLADNDG